MFSFKKCKNNLDFECAYGTNLAQSKEKGPQQITATENKMDNANYHFPNSL
jgi:hypothetical protein